VACSENFGFVEAHQTKREAMVPWLSDNDEKVRSFAEQYIGLLDRQIAAEQRRSEEDLENAQADVRRPEGWRRAKLARLIRRFPAALLIIRASSPFHPLIPFSSFEVLLLVVE